MPKPKIKEKTKTKTKKTEVKDLKTKGQNVKGGGINRVVAG